MAQRNPPDADEGGVPNLRVVLPASLACGDDRACNAHPARTAGRIVVLCVFAALALMACMLLINLR